MKQTAKKTKHVAVRTVWLSVISSIIVGLSSLVLGLSIYGNSLIQESIDKTRSTVSKAASSAKHGTDTAGLAKEVMRIYKSLTPGELNQTGTETYLNYFESIQSGKYQKNHNLLCNILRNFTGDISRLYVCAFDSERNLMVYIVDTDRVNPRLPGEWENVPEDWINKLEDFTDYDWDGENTPYDIWRTKEGRKCVTAYPIQDDNKVTCAYLVAELSINSIIAEIVQYAIKVCSVVLALTLFISFFIGWRIKKAIADPINEIANTATVYVRDRKNGVNRSDHFSSLGIKTGDELENLTNVMADMEQQVIAHEDQIIRLLDSLVKSLSLAIDERSHYTGNHTQNMVNMAEAFLDWMEKNGNPWEYDDTRRRVFMMSVGLHDIGKLTVPLEIMDKSTRLGPKLEPIEQRFARMRLTNKIAKLEGRISQEEFEKKRNEAEETLNFILQVNSTGFLTDENLEKVKALAGKTFEDEDGSMQSLLTADEISDLSIRKGTLTNEERLTMQSHASSTFNILNQVEFPEQYSYIPMWASSHHELLQGNGYPAGLKGEQIPREVRLLTILDIFEALTAKDRPYKKPLPLEKALSILDDMVKEGSLDGGLLALFKESKAWEAEIKDS